MTAREEIQLEMKMIRNALNSSYGALGRTVTQIERSSEDAVNLLMQIVRLRAIQKHVEFNTIGM
jgi:hypothetical protein